MINSFKSQIQFSYKWKHFALQYGPFIKSLEFMLIIVKNIKILRKILEIKIYISKTRHNHFCMTFDLLCLLGPLWCVYKGFFKIPLFSSGFVFLMILNPPSGDRKFCVEYPPLSYIKSCVLICILRIWTSFVVFPKQNLA